jgi:predicted RNA-binding Zn ribbon-like protein
VVTLESKRPMTKRIKACAGVAWGGLFYDETKNNSGRWRAIEVCRDRANQRRRAARERGA